MSAPAAAMAEGSETEVPDATKPALPAASNTDGFVPEQQDEDGSKSQEAQELQPEQTELGAEAPAIRWDFTLAWAGGILVWYFVVQLMILPWAMRPDPMARELMLTQVPIRVYQYSEAAFFTAAVLNLISFVFEETQEKRQLALLSALIKLLSWHCDYLIVTGQAVIVFDAYHALLLPSRYVQWSCTTPTMLFSLSKISDFTPQQTAWVMFCDWMMILTGYIAAVYPPGFISYTALFFSFVTMFVVLHGLYLILTSAMAEANSRHAIFSLEFTLWSSMVIWNLFPVAWVLARMGPTISPLAEPLSMFSNFAAKVVFSSCVLYNNYVTLQQRRIAAQREQEHKDRIRMVDELKESLRHKDEFISVIGHELRTPLNAIIQLSSAIAPNVGNPSMVSSHRVWMETITRSARHLMGIINDIITVRAARSGIHLKQELVQVKVVVDHAMHALHPSVKRGVTMERVIQDKLPPIVADERRMIQMLSNLLGNALKFTDKGKVTVNVGTDKGARNVVIKIQDTGCGIPKSELKNLLVPFKQVDMSSSRKYGGTGLGLSIANQLVQAHSGSLELYSQQGLGTTVVVKLPVLQPETQRSLELKFRTAYTAAGYDPEELLNPVLAKAEGRHSAIFCELSHDGHATGAPALHKSLSHQEREPVDRMEWDADLADIAASAAGSAEGGPPPMAVALFSQLYASTAATTTKQEEPPPKGLSPARTGRKSLLSRGSQKAIAAQAQPTCILDEMAASHNLDSLEQQLQQAQQALLLALEAERTVNQEQRGQGSLSGAAAHGLDELESQLLRAQAALEAAVQAEQDPRNKASGNETRANQQHIETLEQQLLKAQHALALAMEAERTVTSEQQPGALGTAASDHLENLELQLLQAQHALAAALEAAAANHPDGALHSARGSSDATAGGTPQGMPQQQLCSGVREADSPGAGFNGGKDMDGKERGHRDSSAEPLNEEDDEFDPYPGAWHRAPQFGDGQDGNKEYYSYDSRMSYEYRPSLDMPGLALANASQQSNRSSKPPPPVSRASLSFKGVKSAIRRSIDIVKLKSMQSGSQAAANATAAAQQLSGRSTTSFSVGPTALVKDGEAAALERGPNSMTALEGQGTGGWQVSKKDVNKGLN